MSSKSKRKVSGVSPATAGNPANSTLTRRFSTSAEFNPDYSHVKAGLKRIAVLAGSFIVILVLLSFILK